MKFKGLIIMFILSAVTSFAQNEKTSNVLNSEFGTPFNTVPFKEIKVDDFVPALQLAFEKGRKDIDAITNSESKADFENTIVALEQSGREISKISKILMHLNSSETTPQIQKCVREITPLLTDYRNDITLNEELFKRIKSVYDQRDKFVLDTESAMLLEKTYKNFARNGALLSTDQKEKLRSINKELSDLSIRFSENVLNETNEYSLHITNREDLIGLPDFALETALAAAKKAGKEGWIFTLQAPSYGPFMQYADNRELRKQLFQAFNSRCFNENKNSNADIINRIVQLRYEKAVLLGYKTWADYILEERMANSKQIVTDFLDEIRKYAEPVAKKEIEELTQYARSQGFIGDSIQRWDYAYYSEKLKKEKFSINDEILKPYFRLDNVLEGIFSLTNKLFGISFKKNNEIQVWHEDVVTYEVYDRDGKLLAIWYGDYFPRPGKRAGAWNNTLRGQWVENGVEYRPHVVNVCNFSKPTETKPSLLTFYEVRTLYHEFGHALHDMLANGKYASLSGTSVAWDFVELPSQLMENFVFEPEVLQLFAKHYETGELIPEELIEKIQASANFMSGMATVRQLSFGLLDMAYHGNKPSGTSIAEIEKQTDISSKFYPKVENYAISTAFSHIFSGGYSAGYYSYKWSEVLDADAFYLFKEKGIFNAEVAQSFREYILSKGGSQKPMELYKKFRGREPKVEAMLKRAGLLIMP